MRALFFLAILLWANVSFALDPNPLHGTVLQEAVDKIEINHFYDDEGRLVFDQMIFYKESKRWEKRMYHVIAWRLIKSKNQIPIRVLGSDVYRYRVMWMDGKHIRDIRCKIVSESWTQEDVEIIEREFLAKEHRQELMKPPVAKLEKNPFEAMLENGLINGIVIFQGTLEELRKMK